jgi:hypothetical protein
MNDKDQIEIVTREKILELINQASIPEKTKEKLGSFFSFLTEPNGEDIEDPVEAKEEVQILSRVLDDETVMIILRSVKSPREEDWWWSQHRRKIFLLVDEIAKELVKEKPLVEVNFGGEKTFLKAVYIDLDELIIEAGLQYPKRIPKETDIIKNPLYVIFGEDYPLSRLIAGEVFNIDVHFSEMTRAEAVWWKQYRGQLLSLLDQKVIKIAEEEIWPEIWPIKGTILGQKVDCNSVGIDFKKLIEDAGLESPFSR